MTAHVVVKHEPFVYYAVKSIYDYCDEILLYDTGSIDHTLEDIYQLLREDVDNKIRFKTIKLDFAEEEWSLQNLSSFIAEHMGKMSVGKCRQMQIDETKTKYFMIVDGDEVHYRSAMESIVNDLLPNLPEDKYAVGLPLTWFYNIGTTFTDQTFPYNGRIIRTDKVYMSKESPNEQHLIKGSNDFFTYEHPNYLIYNKIKPYAHFETVLRPWRRKDKVRLSNVQLFTDSYPEVIVENQYYFNRYVTETQNVK